MKLFRQPGGGCEHTLKKRRKVKKEGIEYTGDSMCQRCCFYDWYYGYRSHYIGHYLELPLILLYRPFWWLKYGRKMDEKGFMPGHVNYTGRFKK